MAVVGECLKQLRERKNLSQGDIEQRTGLLRCYVSRVENGHTVPSVETLEKFARALEVPIYQLFYDGEKPPIFTSIAKLGDAGEKSFGVRGRDAKELARFRRLLGKLNPADRKTLMFLAQKLARS
jgi:transcriptional regulator with XRE-family HTH domain